MLASYSMGQFAELFVNSLAVLGGFLAGYMISAVVANSLDRMAFRRRSPAFLHRSVRLLGGIALATLIAFIVFGHGRGWKLLGGGESGTGETEQSGSPQLISTTQESPPASASPPPPKPTIDSSQKTMTVTILGGADVMAERFYLIDLDTTPRSLAELKELFRQKAEANAMPASVELRFSSRNRLPESHPAVLLLKRWLLDDLHLKVILPPESH